MKSTHSNKLERWLGADVVESISKHYGKFYYPIALHGVPGNVHVMPGGGFTGEIKAGSYFTKEDGAAAVFKKLEAIAEQKASKNRAMATMLEMIRAGDKRMASVGAFASIDAVVAAATGGKAQTLMFMKTGTASNAIGNGEDLWIAAGTPTKLYAMSEAGVLKDITPVTFTTGITDATPKSCIVAMIYSLT